MACDLYQRIDDNWFPTIPLVVCSSVKGNFCAENMMPAADFAPIRAVLNNILFTFNVLIHFSLPCTQLPRVWAFQSNSLNVIIGKTRFEKLYCSFWYQMGNRISLKWCQWLARMVKRQAPAFFTHGIIWRQAHVTKSYAVHFTIIRQSNVCGFVFRCSLLKWMACHWPHFYSHGFIKKRRKRGICPHKMT